MSPQPSAFTLPARRLVFAALLSLFCLPMLAAAEIRIGGTGNALGTMRLLAEAYSRLHPDNRVVVLDSIGTSGAMKAVPKGALDIGLSSRPVNDEEARAGLSATEYAQSPTVFAVQTANKTNGVSIAQIVDIYSGKLSNWQDGTRIRPILRQQGDDNTRQIKRLSPEIDTALANAEQRQGMIFASNDQETADKMESIPGSIGVTTVALIRSEHRALKPLHLDGVEPTPENAHSGRYPLVKQFYFILAKVPSAATLDFIKFVKSPQGRRILETNGHTIP